MILRSPALWYDEPTHYHPLLQSSELLCNLYQPFCQHYMSYTMVNVFSLSPSPLGLSTLATQ